MPLPTPDAYNDAVQNPQTAFADPELRSASVDCNGFGIPKALGGGFAITYRLNSHSGRSFAVRCFHKESPNLQDRYARIHTCLNSLRSPVFVGFEYQHGGIRVKGNGHPIVKMEWATGITLGEYIERNHANRFAMEQLRSAFTQLESDLYDSGIAHGDLQNGNVMVSSQEKLRLVDYDGMFVPGMPSGAGTELGHKHFQHPERHSSHFSNSIDRFSFIVIDLSLWALSLRPELLRQFSTGENILFSANDFADPSSSQVFQALSGLGNGDFREAVGNFAAVCKAPIDSVPRLSEFREGRNIPAVAATTALPSAGIPQKYIAALPVIDAGNFGDVCKHIGDKVELVGQIVEVKPGSTRKGAPYVFINFGHWRDDCVRVTIWSEGLSALGYAPDPTWRGKWIVVNGLIDPVYHGKNRYKTIAYRSIGITLSDRSQLHRISKEEAQWRLGRCEKRDLPRLADPSDPVAARNVAILQGVNGSKSRPSSSPRSPVPQRCPQATKPQPSAPQSISVKARNEAILQTMLPSSGSSTVGLPSLAPKSGGQQQGQSSSENIGCLIVAGIFLVLIVIASLPGC